MTSSTSSRADLKSYGIAGLLVVNILVFLFQDFFKFRTDNYEKMAEKFVTKEVLTLTLEPMNEDLSYIRKKLDEMASRK